MGKNGRPMPGGPPAEEHAKKAGVPGREQKTVKPGTITRARKGQRAARVESPVRTPIPPPTAKSIVSGAPAPRTLTYGSLREYHLNRIRFGEDGVERPRGVLKNHNSVINSWIKFRLREAAGEHPEGSGDLLALGDEIGLGFQDALNDYLEDQEGQRKKKTTINDRRSIMLSVRESAAELTRLDGLPEGFAEALDYLVRHSGMTFVAIAEAVGVEESRFRKWRMGKGVPWLRSLPVIERLEDLFKLRRGTLLGRLPAFEVTSGDAIPRTCTTPWREHIRLLQKLPYTLKKLPSRVEAEFKDLVAFKTDDVWVELHGLERGSEWRIRQNRGTCPSADMFYKFVNRFFSYLHLPPDAEHPLLRGKGLAPEALTLALCGDAELVLSFAEFMKERSYCRGFNSGVVNFLVQCKTMLNLENGFLRQQPHYGQRLPEPVSAGEWDGWCDANRRRMSKFLTALKKSKNSRFKRSRDPFDAVRNIIEGRQHPISALMEMAAILKKLIPTAAVYQPKRMPILMRDIAFVEFITSFPMRVENFSMMTWIPVDPADLLACDKEYVETTEDSNLYQRPDGSWWIRFHPEGVKNAKAIDVPVVDSVVPSLREYLLRHRPALNQALKRAIGKRREQKNLPPLTPEEESAINFCPFVFRPGVGEVSGANAARLLKWKGVEQMTISSLSYRMFKLTQRYIPGCKGFRAHAVRHIVASEYIKNYPNGYVVAAAALNITEAVVREHYAWVRPCDRIKPWQEYHESLRKKLDNAVSLA